MRVTPPASRSSARVRSLSVLTVARVHGIADHHLRQMVLEVGVARRVP